MLSTTPSEGYRDRTGFCSGRGDYYSTLHISVVYISSVGEPPKARNRASLPFNSRQYLPISRHSDGSTRALTRLLPVSGYAAFPETEANPEQGAAPECVPQASPTC